MREPVGMPPVTSDAERRERWTLIAAGFESFAITPHDIFAGGNEAAARWTAEGRMRAGKDIRFDGISTFTLDDTGTIISMSAYFDMAALVAQVQG
jgi:ketosteroid isomerase-like protein